YGPRMRLNDGRAIPAFLSQALEGNDVTVFGNGSQTRSVCYVDDLIEGIYRLLVSNEVYPVNIGNQDEITMLQLAKEVIELAGSRSKIVFKDLPEDDPKVRQPDTTRAQTILQWKARIDRKEGLKRTIEYFRSQIR
ncbi:MAG TPA: NAD-dependent dehydratase, partial [Bacteroidetes bacterium]|nr:NAD-dependent dehydratase [Bacteroidota bacterium]